MDDDKLLDLLLQWEERHDQGQDVTAEELCWDCPDFIEPLKERIQALQKTAWMKQPIDKDQPDPPDHSPPRTLADRYRLDKLAGEGSFGQVWKAFDLELHRPVAVKLPKPSRKFSENEIERFVAEARKVAQLRHPGIVAVHDIHRSGGAYFFVTDWIEGSDLAQRLRHGPLPQTEAVRLVAEVARILAHAHGQGFVHRDIKPANILLDAQGKPLVCDFGIAATEQELLHEPQCLLATLAYGSPEQIAGQPVDARTDIYSLGVVLFELLAGRLPFDDSDPTRLRKRVLTTPAPSLRSLNPAIPKDLERIVSKCLAKNPADRQASAEVLADDLDACLTPRTIWNTLLLSGIVGVLLLIGGGMFWWKPWSQSSPPREQVGEVRRMTVARSQVVGVAHSPTNSWVASAGLDCMVRLWDVNTAKEIRTFQGHRTWVRAVVFSQDGRWLFSSCGGSDSGGKLWGGDDFSIRMWDVECGTQERSFVGHTDPVVGLAVNNDATRLLSCGDDETIRLWNVATGKEERCFKGHVSHVRSVAFSPDARHFISGGHDMVLRVWDVGSGEIVGRCEGHSHHVMSVTYSPGSKFIASGSKDTTIRIWDAHTFKETRRLMAHRNQVWSIAFSLDGRFLLSGDLDGLVCLWDVESGEDVYHFRGHVGAVNSVTFSPDGLHGVSGGEDGSIRLWRLPGAK